MADDDDETVELTLRLPADMVRRIELMTPGARLPDVLKEGLAALLEAAEAHAAPAPDGGAPATTSSSAPAIQDEPPDRRPEPTAPPTNEPVLPVLAVGDATLVLERLDRLQGSVTQLTARLIESEGRERRALVWVKTMLAELFAHTTPFPTAADERARRLEAAERLGKVDERVMAYVRNGRDLNGTGGETPSTS